jgi:arylsulfatase A-like enzyme
LQQGFDVDVPHHPGPGPAGSFVAPWKFKDFDHDPAVLDQHIEDRMAREAVTWMERNRARPFCLNYWMFSVHAPFDAKQALIDKHRARVKPDDPQRSPTYAAMVESMDDAVGTLLDALIEKFLTDTKAVVPVPNPAFDPAKYHPELEGQQKPKAKAQPEAAAKTAPASDDDPCSKAGSLAVARPW